MSFAPEGRPFIAIGLVILAGLVAFGVWQGGPAYLPAVLWAPVALWIPLFFRDPVRNGPRGADLILAPADGQVVSVVTTDEPDYIKGVTTRVSVFMNVFNVHVNRTPADGTVEYRRYRPGKFLNATLDKASEHNEQMSLGIRSARGPLLVRQIAGLIARRIVTDPVPGTEVRQGERIGLIRFGSRVDTFLPKGAVSSVTVGQRTVAGVTVIGKWTS